MPRFRKKPITIEARQILDDMAVVDNISRWITTHGGKVSWPFVPDSDHVLSIETMEGEMVAGLGDWIIRGVAGEFYPCKPDIFEQTYEPVGGDDRGGATRGRLHDLDVVLAEAGIDPDSLDDHGDGRRG